jgi:hypothetical protein
VAAVVRRLGNGYDLTDEASYLQAADPAAPGDAFNGFFGYYLRPLCLLTGWSVLGVRLLGLGALVAAAVLLGWGAARLLGRPPAPVVALTVAGTTGYYAFGVRTPSYNWLAVVGAALACAAVLHLLAGGRSAWGLLAGAGVVVTVAGKATSGVLLLVVVVAASASVRRFRALAWSAAGAFAVMGLHLALLLGPGDSLRLLRRTAAVLPAVDPDHYSVRGAVVSVLTQLPAALAAAVAVGLLGGLQALAVPPPPARAAWFARHCAAVAVVGTAAVLGTRLWAGGYDRRLEFGSGVLPVVAALIAAAVAARRRGLRGSGDRRPGIAVAVLVLAAAAVTACVAVGAAVVAVESHHDPKRGAPLAAATVPVRLGPAVVRLDQDSAAALAGLVASARAAGWRDGDRLVDTAYVPAVPLALHARVPPVLLPGFPVIPPAASALLSPASRRRGATAGSWCRATRPR